MSARRIPTRRLPAQPNLQQLRKQAKEFASTDPATTLSEAQRDLARSYGFDSWPKLKAFVDGANVARLTAAIQAGDLPTARALLKSRPELVGIDTAPNDEHRALHYAVLRRDPAMVRLLMRHGADARKGIFPHRSATTAIALARDREYPDIVAIIEEEEQKRSPEAPPGDRQIDSPIRDAIALADRDRVRHLIQNDPSLLTRDNDWRRGGLLTLAVRHGHLDMVRTLLDLGADVDERIILEELEEPTESRGQPLWLAAANRCLDIATLLLDRGADPNANPYASGWPIDRAFGNRDDAMKQLLLSRGAQLKPWTVTLANDLDAARRLLAADTSEETAREFVWSAACNGCPEILAVALPHLDSWPLNDPRWNWILVQPPRRAADEALDESHFTCMAMLLAHGVDPDVVGHRHTVLQFVAARDNLSEPNRVRFAAMLLDRGASLTFRDGILKSTPLGWACRWGRKELVELLLARGAKPEEPDAEPWAAPLAWATKMGHAEIVALLMR